jgi:hypothetical protein
MARQRDLVSKRLRRWQNDTSDTSGHGGGTVTAVSFLTSTCRLHACNIDPRGAKALHSMVTGQGVPPRKVRFRLVDRGEDT